MNSGGSREPSVGLVWALGAALLLAPLIAGSNRAWPLSVLSVALATLLLAAWVATILAGHSPLQRIARGALPLAALGLMALLAAAQWQAGWEGETLHSATPYSTLYFLLKTLTYAAAFILVLLLARTAGRRRGLLLVLAGSGLLQALLAIWLLSISAEYQWFFQWIEHSGGTKGTFLNRDHLAAYLYLCLSAGIGLLLASLSGRTPGRRNLRRRVVSALEFILSPRMLLRMGLVVMVIALVLTRSRMGNAAFFGALIVLGSVVAAAQPALRRKALVLVASLVIVDLLIVGQWVGLERVVQRLEQTAVAAEDKRGQETVEERLQAARLTLPMIAERPWFGWGGGSFHSAFPPYKVREMNLRDSFVDHAHSDYVEIAADVGLVGLALFGTIVLASLWRIARLLRMRHRQESSARAVAYAGLMAIVCLALHSLVDFNLQISANALTITVLLGLVWATPLDAGRQEPDVSSSGRPAKAGAAG